MEILTKLNRISLNFVVMAVNTLRIDFSNADTTSNVPEFPTILSQNVSVQHHV